jgi:hypothetical protein
MLLVLSALLQQMLCALLLLALLLLPVPIAAISSCTSGTAGS